MVSGPTTISFAPLCAAAAHICVGGPHSGVGVGVAVGAGVSVPIGVAVAVGTGVSVPVGVGVGVTSSQLAIVMTLESSVTSPFRASARPDRVAFVGGSTIGVTADSIQATVDFSLQLQGGVLRAAVVGTPNVIVGDVNLNGSGFCLNHVLHALWRGRFFQASLPLGADGTADLDACLPPVVKVLPNNEAELMLGDFGAVVTRSKPRNRRVFWRSDPGPLRDTKFGA